MHLGSPLSFFSLSHKKEREGGVVVVVVVVKVVEGHPEVYLEVYPEVNPEVHPEVQEVQEVQDFHLEEVMINGEVIYRQLFHNLKD